jgi:PAS domain S-box-containing protein
MTRIGAADGHCESLPKALADTAQGRHPSDLQLIRALADSAPVAIYHTDSAGEMTYVNPEYRAIFGLAPTQSADDWAQAVHPSDRARIDAACADFYREPAAVHLEYRTVNKSGGIRYLAEHVVPVSAEGVGGFVGTITDVTDLKEAQSELETLHRRLMDASRQAGRAEIATSILHNVGNVLNSVNISASVVADHVKNSKATRLNRVVTLLQENEADLGKFFTDDDRGKQLPGYLAMLASQVKADQDRIVTELASLQQQIDHIKEIVAMQQNYAKRGGAAETVEVVALVEESLRLDESAFTRNGIALHRVFASVPAIVVDRHKVLQILVNLLSNAKQACEASGRAEKLITLRIDTGGLGVRIVVMDNGVGISAENLIRVFGHGFTTKKEGHGFGLHSGALTAKELGGQLRAESDGPGLGATFTLDLPVRPPATRHG